MTLIGATTENPYFEVNSALLSRGPDLRAAAARAGRDRAAAASGRSPTPSAGSPIRPTVDDDGARAARRRAPAATRAPRSSRSSGRSRPRAAPARRSTSRSPRTRCSARRSLYDRDGDRHYDYISAWIKATRGSDPDASLYYLAVMLEGGEDPRFIARRMVILASEDIGNADPQALGGRDRRGRGGRPRRAARVRAQPRPGGDLPGARAEVERLLPWRSQRAARPRARARRASRRRRTCATPTTRARRSSAAATATTTRTTSPGGVADQPLMPGGARGRALLRADRPRASRRSCERLASRRRLERRQRSRPQPAAVG